nr:PREDICTED: DNA repair and recombination protein RAD54B-like [Bemisia tabaci]
MRKSGAPSRNSATGSQAPPGPFGRNFSEKNISGAARSRESVLSLLSDSQDSDTDFSFSTSPFSDKAKKAQDSPCAPSPNSTQGTEKLYEVVFGKPSTKKHKTWDGDGTLLVNVEKNTATLKDSNGKVLGQISKFKLDELESGNFLNIGGKVVDVVGLLSENTCQPVKQNPSKRSAGNLYNPPLSKKPCQVQLSRTTSLVKPKQRLNDHGTSETEDLFAGSSVSSTTGNNFCSKPKIFAEQSNPAFLDSDFENDAENCNSTNINSSSSYHHQESSKTANNTRIYEVVFGRPSTKKHKTWDGDGTLLIDLDEKLATLKDDKGKILGTKANFKMEMLEEEEYFSIGGKVVDVLGPINSVSSSKTQNLHESSETTFPKINPMTRKHFKPPSSFEPPKTVKTEVKPLNTEIVNSAPKPSLFTTFKSSCVEPSSSGNLSTLTTPLISCAPSLAHQKNEVTRKRSVQDVLALLSTPTESEDLSLTPDFLPSNDSQSNECNTANPSNNFRKFNVMMAKVSTKKNKTWEEDGILEFNVETKVGELKKTNGMVLGRSKIDSVESGSRFVIASKEVEILQEVSDSAEKSPEWKTRSYPKVVASTAKRCVPLFSRGKSAISMQNLKPLVLPKPSYEHQWKFNENHRPVVDVSIEAFLLRVLRDHQREGVKFLFSCVSGVRDINYFGAILADEMGLGKTLQSITVIWTMLRQNFYQGEPLCKRVLIVTPSSLTKNWQNEFIRWLGSHRIKVFVVDQKNKARDYCKLPANRNPVLIISYEMYVKSAEDLSEIKFDLLICDEGHRLKNTNIKVATCLNKLDCSRRILLTGTPIQNDLQEFYALVNFVNPGILGSPLEFKRQYADPITFSRQPGIDQDAQQLGEERAAELNELSSGFILRRTQDVNDKYLPNKHEMIIFCSSTKLQQDLYEATVQYWEDRNLAAPGSDSGIKHLSVITALKKICNHPFLLKRKESEDFYFQEESLKNFLNNMLPEEETESETPLTQYSSKFLVIDNLLAELRATSKERIVLVSYSTQTLDLLATLCDRNRYKYLRLDGTTPAAQRIPIVDRFNSDKDHFVFLLSAKAGGVGLNLVGASRLVLFDSDWNPATDLQAMSRIWRDGQKKSVFIYRLFSAGTIEEKILQRQISKTGISSAVVDPKNNSHVRLSIEELKDLFRYEPDCLSSTHDMLNCTCSGSGSVPDVEEAEEEGDDMFMRNDRDCQISLDDEECSTTSNVLRMNQLMQWEHYAKTIDADFLQMLCLSSSDEFLTFIFHNKTTTEVGSQ